MNTNPHNSNKSFLDVYKNSISPLLKEIDLLIKKHTSDIPVFYISKLLSISDKEIKSIMHQEDIKNINSSDIFSLLINGTSYICHLIMREIECGSPYFYTSQTVSYIYEIDKKEVDKAFKFLELEKINSSFLPAIFAQIPYNKNPL